MLGSVLCRQNATSVPKQQQIHSEGQQDCSFSEEKEIFVCPIYFTEGSVGQDYGNPRQCSQNRMRLCHNKQSSQQNKQKAPNYNSNSTLKQARHELHSYSASLKWSPANNSHSRDLPVNHFVGSRSREYENSYSSDPRGSHFIETGLSEYEKRSTCVAHRQMNFFPECHAGSSALIAKIWPTLLLLMLFTAVHSKGKWWLLLCICSENWKWIFTSKQRKTRICLIV